MFMWFSFERQLYLQAWEDQYGMTLNKRVLHLSLARDQETLIWLMTWLSRQKRSKRLQE